MTVRGEQRWFAQCGFEATSVTWLFPGAGVRVEAPASEAGFIGLSDLAAFFGTESRHHMLDADYLSAWYPKRADERRAFLERIGKAVPFWLGTPSPA